MEYIKVREVPPKGLPDSCFHEWSRWSKIIDTDEAWKKIQLRECIVCGLVDRRGFRVYSRFTMDYCMASTMNDALEKVRSPQ